MLYNIEGFHIGNEEFSSLEDADADHPNIEVERLCGKLFLITDKDGLG